MTDSDEMNLNPVHSQNWVNSYVSSISNQSDPNQVINVVGSIGSIYSQIRMFLVYFMITKCRFGEPIEHVSKSLN